jgi:hypothetical protein
MKASNSCLQEAMAAFGKVKRDWSRHHLPYIEEASRHTMVAVVGQQQRAV